MHNTRSLGGMTVSILGCGWLGLGVAKDLITLGVRVKGSSTSAQRLRLLSDLDIDPYLIQCRRDIEGDRLPDFFNSDVLIVTLPFKRHFNPPSIYVDQMNLLKTYLQKSPLKMLIFTSSTGIYDGCSGEVNENTALSLDKPRVAALAQVESDLMAIDTLDTCILRLAGLYGPDRALGTFWAGKHCPKPANTPVNLLHQADCIAIIRSCIQQGCTGIYNAVSDRHPSRQHLYTHAALRMGLAPPLFNSTLSDSLQRQVSNQALKRCLRYAFLYPDPMGL
ncbi:MAG: hypothetical protein VW378_02350 [bacterium]